MTTQRFDEESRAFLQTRLRTLSGVLALLLGVLTAAFMASMLRDRSVATVLVDFLTAFPNALLFYLAALMAACWGLLRARALGSRALAIVDGVMLEALIAMCLALYASVHAFSFSGFAFVVPFLVLFLLARAVLIPSSALRTLVLSLPAPVAVFAIQMSHGASYAYPGQAYPPSHFSDTWIQNQVCLLGAIAVAVTASRVNLSLRRRNYDARRVGQYDVHEQIGAGGMGEVYRATHALLKRETALKFLRPEIAGADSLERFEQEVRIASSLTHPNNISIFDYGYTAEGVFYYAMELLDGATLKQVVDASGPLPQARAIHFAAQALAALAEAHAKGFLHRDIKTANIMVCERGGELDCVKVLDFGLAKPVDDSLGVARADGEVAGSPETMAPEAIRGEDVGPASDLYSLSVVLYQLLAGRHPFVAETGHDMLVSHLSTTPQSFPAEVSVSPALRELILEGLSKVPSERPASAKIYRERLLACRGDESWTEDEAARWWASYEPSSAPEPSESEISTSSSETLYKSDSFESVAADDR